MKKKLIYFSIFLSVIFFIYSFLWFFFSYNISNNFNKQFAGKAFNISSLTEEEYWCKFSKITPHGFPFKLGFKIHDWEEESKISKIIFNSDLKILYNIFGKFLEISHNGDVISQYKPLESGFGGKLKNDSILKFHMILSMNLINKLRNINNPLELMNFIDFVEFNSNIFEIYDLVSDDLIYSEKDTKFLFSFGKHEYYNNFIEFTKNPPQNLHMNYSNNVTTTQILNKIVKPGILLFRPMLPFTGKFSHIIDLKLGNNIKNFTDIIKNLEINVNAISDTDDLLMNSDFIYKSYDFENNQNFLSLNLNSELILKHSINEQLLRTAKSLSTISEISQQNKILIQELEYIKDNIEKFAPYKIDSKKYQLVLDFDMITKNKELKRFSMNNLSILSDNNIGFKTNAKANIDDIEVNKIDFSSLPTVKGDLLIFNYHDFLNIVLGYLFNLGKFKNYSDESKDVHINGIEYFLKLLSDHPKSTNQDISFNYEIFMNDLQNSKFGSIKNVSTIPNLYCVFLFKFASSKYATKIQNIDYIKGLVPECIFLGNEIEEIYNNFVTQIP